MATKGIWVIVRVLLRLSVVVARVLLNCSLLVQVYGNFHLFCHPPGEKLA